MARTDFLDISAFLAQEPKIGLLPFRFARFDHDRYLLTNDIGDYMFLSPTELEALISKRLDPNSGLYLDLRAKNFISDDRASVHPRILASRYRTKKAFLDGFTKLHIFVVSLRCDHSCPYCQVSRQSEDRHKFDMSTEIAQRGVDLMLSVPSPVVTCEFQGGESLLNFPLLKEIVRYAKERNASVGKKITFVACTNLSTLTNAHLDFFKEHDVQVSTSLDGPAYLHDKNRPLSRASSHALFERNLRMVQEALGRDKVSALMTTTKESLGYPKEIIDEYLRLDLTSIFLRPLSPFGFAAKTAKAIGYNMSRFLQFYRQALDYIIELNRNGTYFSESYATIILEKILTPFANGYVDLQSPAGAGLGVVVYNYDGDVYASDESRMLAEMGDTSLKLGNVLENSYEEIFFGSKMQALAAASCNESLPGCSDCAYQPYCGADPVYHYATQGDLLGHRPTSGYSSRNMSTIKHLLSLLHSQDKDLENIFWSWINRVSKSQVELPEAAWL
jgi:His-Xaa-Ser system radical SAM maturase HxsB